MPPTQRRRLPTATSLWKRSLAATLVVAALASFGTLAEAQISGSDDSTNLEESPFPPERWIEMSEDRREIYGFENDSTTLQRLAEMYPQPTPDRPFLMTDAELREFQTTEAVAVEAQSTFFQLVPTMPEYGGVILEDGGRTYTVLLTEDSEVLRSAVRASFHDPERLMFRTVKYSKAQLVSEKDRLAAKYFDHFRDGIISSMGVSTTQNAITVAVPAEHQAVAELVDLDTTFPLVQEIGGGGATYLSCTDRSNCNDPQRGGVRIQAYNDLLNHCSSGLTMRKSSGDEFQTTAGHCWDELTSLRLVSGSAGTFGYLNSNVSWRNDPTPESDARAVATLDAETFNWVYRSDTPQGVIGQGHTYAAADAGTPVCLWASLLVADNCGTIQSNFYSKYYPPSQTTIPTFVIMNPDANCVPGNSGGAVTSVSGFTGVGMISFKDNDRCGFSHIHYIQNDLNASLSTSP